MAYVPIHLNYFEYRVGTNCVGLDQLSIDSVELQVSKSDRDVFA